MSVTVRNNEAGAVHTCHGIRRRGSDADAPGRSIRDEDRGQSGEDHGEHNRIALIEGEVAGEVGCGPVLEYEGAENQYRNREKVVVEHGYHASAYWAALVQDDDWKGVLSKSLKLVSLMRFLIPST